MSKKRNRKENILKIIARSRYTPRTVLMLDKENRTQRVALDYYRKLNYIKEKKIQERTKEGVFTEKLYSITKSGMMELYEKSSQDWTEELDPEKIRTARNINMDTTGDKERERLTKKTARITEVRIISEKIGAKTSAVTQMKAFRTNQETENDRETLVEIAEGAINRWNRFHEEIGDESNLHFVDLTEIKEELIGAGIIKNAKEDYIENTIDDFKRCLLDGILVSEDHLFAMYANIGAHNNWYEWCVRQDVNIIKLWIAKKYTGKRNTDELNGIMFVKNSIQFFRVYNDGNLRPKENPIGTGYSSFYILPVNADGIQLLNLLAKIDIEWYDGLITEQVHEIGFFINEIIASDVFQYTNAKEEFLWIGIWMDVLKMKKIQVVHEMKPDIKIIILCTEWQKKYYRTIFPYADLLQYEMPE